MRAHLWIEVNRDLGADPLVSFRFSITKWIHLNDGDDGLRNFFKRAFDCLRPGGVFVLEPQEWDTYAKARLMDQVSPELEIRPIRGF